MDPANVKPWILCIGFLAALPTFILCLGLCNSVATSFVDLLSTGTFTNPFCCSGGKAGFERSLVASILPAPPLLVLLFFVHSGRNRLFYICFLPVLLCSLVPLWLLHGGFSFSDRYLLGDRIALFLIALYAFTIIRTVAGDLYPLLVARRRK